MEEFQFTVQLLVTIAILCPSVLNAQNNYTVFVANNGISNTTCCAGSQNTPCRSIDLSFTCIHQIPHTNFITVTIEAGYYNLSANNTLTTFTGWAQGITIQGTSGHVEIHCEPGAGLAFIEAQRIVLRNISFSGCGQLHDSTSWNFLLIQPSFMKFHSTLYFLFCANVTISHSTISESDGTGLVMYSTVGNVTIEYSQFLNNSVTNTTTFPGGGGLYIEFAYCAPGNTTCVNGNPNVPLSYTHDANYYIHYCTFENNQGRNTDYAEQYTFILPQKFNHIAFGRGGGVSVFFKGIASNNTIIVNGSSFINNTALWGGGIFAEYQDYASHNRLFVYNATITGNKCYHAKSSRRGTGGGGSRVGFIFFEDTHVHNNSIEFEQCNFLENRAYFGGGLSFYTAREPSESSPTNSLRFVNCTWESNIARAGSAVDLSVWHPSTHGALVRVVFDSCHFEHNTANYTSQLGVIVGIGAMYLDSIPILFTESVSFKNNTHSALAAVNTGIYFSQYCVANFIGNTGQRGDALALLGYAFIEVNNDCTLYFINNTAEVKGGAIFGQSIGEHDLISSRNCFIRYADIRRIPEEWNCKFFFEGNYANGRNSSIYATSLLTCLWGTVYGSAETNASKVFCWSKKIWNYSRSDCEGQIHTSPAKFSHSNQSLHLDVIAGKNYMLPITMLDDRGANVTNMSVFTAKSLSQNLYIDSSTQYISDTHIKIHGKSNTLGKFSLDTIHPRVVHTEITVGILPCPPGMIGSGHGAEAVCKCGGDYGGLVNCHPDAFNAQLQAGSWIGNYTPPGTNKAQVVAGVCLYCSQISGLKDLPLPTNESELQNDLCGKIHRDGPLCGKCQEGYGLATSAVTLTCVKCSEGDMKYHWVFFLLSDFLPIIVMFIVVIIFEIRATSAGANSFVFFAQVLPIAFNIDGNGKLQIFDNNVQYILNSAYIAPLSVMNLDFLFFPPYCLGQNVSTLLYISLGYVKAAFPLILIILLSLFLKVYESQLCEKVRNKLPQWKRSSLIHTFATFLLLSYTKFTLVSFILLNRTPLMNDQGHPVGPGVVYYDGTVDYLHGEHVTYVAISIPIMLSFVALPPLLLSTRRLLPKVQSILSECYMPCVRYCSSLCHTESTMPYTLNRNRENEENDDTLGHNRDSEIEERNTHRSTESTTERSENAEAEGTECDDTIQTNMRDMEANMPKVQLFLDTFQGDYKNGLEGDTYKIRSDYRWFAGLYFFLRVAIFAIYAFAPYWFMQCVLQQFVCITAIGLLAVLRPYKDDFYNKLDTFVFILLVAINTLTMFNFYMTTTYNDPSMAVYIVQLILVYAYIIPALLYFIVQFCKRSPTCTRMIQTCRQGYVTVPTNDPNDQYLNEVDERITEDITPRTMPITPHTMPLTSPISIEEESLTEYHTASTQPIKTNNT